ncbi:MAG: MATE family efflux transporter [Pseudopedobacter saltans]|uniref:Multidrug-efflux transporter n=1 Tax=Pseudopedobacter saltans TaxID=151895 RepID=A0A2W5FDD8_9SPHI|nr:MAG: MATE family efflux transporter [Pseudopedobacter saltans]
MKQEAIKTLKLSAPIILGELTQMSLGIINSAMVGHLDYRQLAASALVNSVMNIPFVLGIGISMCISQTVATANGKGDKGKVSHYFYNGIVLMIITALLISLLLELIQPVLFHLGQDRDVAILAGPYLRLMGFSVIPMLLFFALKQFTDGLELTKTAMVLSIASMPLNVLFDYTFIFGHFGFPKMELLGAGIGTLVTRTLVLIVLGLIICFHPRFRPYMEERKKQWFLSRKTFQELLHIGIPSGLQGILEVAAFAVSGILAGQFSAIALASHQIALQTAAFTFMVSMGLAQGASIRIGNAFGRKDWNQIRNIGKSTFYTGLLYGVICAILFVVFRNYLPLIFNKNINVIAVTANLFLFAAIFQISDATQAIGVGLLRGLKDVTAPTVYMAVAYWVLGIPIGWFLGFHFQWGVYGLWTGFVIGLSIVSILLNRRFNQLTKRFV